MNETSQGFTLVEVLLALLLLTAALLAAAPMFTYAMRETATGADLGSVGAIAVDRMEVLRLSEFTAMAPGGSLSTNMTGYSDISMPGFTVRWQIVGNASPPTLKTISVRAIATRTATGLAKDVTLTSVRAR